MEQKTGLRPWVPEVGDVAKLKQMTLDYDEGYGKKATKNLPTRLSRLDNTSVKRGFGGLESPILRPIRDDPLL